MKRPTQMTQSRQKRIWAFANQTTSTNS